MMRKTLTLILVGVTALSLAACGGGASASAITTPAPVADGEIRDDEIGAPEKDVKTTTLKLAFNQSEKHPQYLALSEMNDAFYEATDGAYRIEISPNEFPGSQKGVFELVQSDIIQMVMVVNFIVEDTNPDFAVLDLPYAYDSAEHQKKVFTSGALDDIFASIEANNFNAMTTFTARARCIYTDKPVQTPADLKGCRICVMESQTCIAMLGAIGGMGTPVVRGEVYIATQRGVISGGGDNEITYADLEHYEVAPYLSYARRLMIPGLLAMDTVTLKGVSEEDQQALEDLCKEYTEREFQLWDEGFEGAKSTVEEAGAQLIGVDIAPFQEACQPVIDNVTSESGEAGVLYEKVHNLASQQRFVESEAMTHGVSKENSGQGC